MTAGFTAILNMTITASYVAAAVMVIRLFLNKAPKIFSYVLWLAVLIRLVLPFSFPSAFSFLSFLTPTSRTGTGALEFVPSTLGLMLQPAVDTGVGLVNQAVNTSLPAGTPTASVNPMTIIMEIAGMVWVIGMVVLLLYFVVSYFKITSNLKTATLVSGNIYETDRITTPLVCGFIKPKIYVPLGLSDHELSYIVAHEQVHIRRLDYLVKPFAWLLLSVYWFNPLMWVSFNLMSKDMEMSCDEKVIASMGQEVKLSYSKSLLSLSVRSSGFSLGRPLAFGESHIQARIRNVLSYRKPRAPVTAAACVFSLICILGFTANPQGTPGIPLKTMENHAAVWANALIIRDGEPRYEMMSETMREKFKQEQIARSGEDWNYNIGVSSPWVVTFEVKIEDHTAHITYFTQTSEPASYLSEEAVTFGRVEGEVVVVGYESVYEDVKVEDGM
ncbi:M56 family metallopeptidase [Paenibacillus donghaensis]|uniref:Peptidase M56 domain-containing protein n=1 Tax=Paenibacillus donghaensis TaxID=414771 RepID=A0A2Z2KPY8_9BACL|nr:M56 family metallopeptidase [Paenibacillus donghaensis]ASA25823.1 hypothetical protein B9T62_36900 [Paenibacillus donghaensis]